MAGLVLWKQKCLRVRLECVHIGFLWERKGKVVPFRGAEVKGAGTNSGKSGSRNLDAESIRSRAESTGGCVELKTITENKPQPCK